jgi:hypothetical protein
MTHSPRRAVFALLLAVFLPASVAEAQAGAAGKTLPNESSPVTAKGVHRFWDKENLLLFTGVAAGRALDFTSTQHFRERGLDEWLLTNGIVDNKPLFTGIEAGGVAASIGVSYLFHRTGHHKLERWVSIVHAGVGGGGAIRNYSLKATAPGQ